MGYVENIRKVIGHSPLIMCGCGCLIYNDKGQILLQRRSDDGLWCAPGGSIELGETIEEACVREVKEETNLDIDLDDLIFYKVYSGEGQHHIYPNKDEMYYVSIYFKVYKYKNDFKVDSESLDLKFFDIDKIPSNINKMFIPVRDDLIKKNNK